MNLTVAACCCDLAPHTRLSLMSAYDAVDGSSTGTSVPKMWVLLRPHDSEEPSMQAVTTIGRQYRLAGPQFSSLRQRLPEG